MLLTFFTITYDYNLLGVKHRRANKTKDKKVSW